MSWQRVERPILCSKHNSHYSGSHPKSTCTKLKVSTPFDSSSLALHGENVEAFKSTRAISPSYIKEKDQRAEGDDLATVVASCLG